ncbi:MAG: class I SAM-dependent methyltransferase [Clostridia bacterium]|nr:class I SAM-dependent methyltransferase [Clostridia bacterium]MDD4048738.1 class I SAM-dependent methyltransferase [Clostridia bacterium]
MKQNSKWHYDEFEQVGVDYTDLQEVQAYDLRMQKLRNIKQECEYIRGLIKTTSSDCILEIGTGTGELALDFSAYCRKVIAIDVSPRMIELAQKKAKSQNKSNVEFQNAGFLTYESTEGFDAIVTQLSLHHLPDYWKMIALRRSYEILKDGGKFYLRDVVFPAQIKDYDGYFRKIISGLRKVVGEKIAEETEVHIKEEFSTLDWIMEGLLKSVGFNIEQANYYDGFMASYLCIKKEHGV